MPDWACTRCGAINLDGQRMCEGCGLEAAKPSGPRGGHVVKSKPVPEGAPPCTIEQNRAALKITLDVHRGVISAAEGRRQLVALFGMPELEHEA